MAKPKPLHTAAEDAALAANVDELGSLEREFAPLAFKYARIDVLRRAIRDYYGLEDGSQLFLATAERFCVSVGANSRQRVINVPALRTLIGARLFNSIAEVSLKVLAAEVPGAIVDQVSSYVQTGPRPLKVFEKGEAV